MIMRQREKATQQAQASTGGGTQAAGSAASKRPPPKDIFREIEKITQKFVWNQKDLEQPKQS